MQVQKVKACKYLHQQSKIFYSSVSMHYNLQCLGFIKLRSLTQRGQNPRHLELLLNSVNYNTENLPARPRLSRCERPSVTTRQWQCAKLPQALHCELRLTRGNIFGSLIQPLSKVEFWSSVRVKNQTPQRKISGTQEIISMSLHCQH